MPIISTPDTQWTLLISAVGGALAATIVSWAKNYFGEKGKNFATRQDIQQLQRQLQENTDITKSIEQTYTRQDYLWRSELAFRERQLSEFYGPAYGYVMSEKEIVKLWLEFKLTDVNLKIKQLLRDHNQILRDLIISKAHLIEGAVMPDSFVRFFTSTLVFDLYAVPTEEGQVPEHLENDSRTAYPKDFDEHIIATTERLKARIEMLHQKYAAPLAASPELEHSAFPAAQSPRTEL